MMHDFDGNGFFFFSSFLDFERSKETFLFIILFYFFFFKKRIKDFLQFYDFVLEVGLF